MKSPPRRERCKPEVKFRFRIIEGIGAAPPDWKNYLILVMMDGREPTAARIIHAPVCSLTCWVESHRAEMDAVGACSFFQDLARKGIRGPCLR